MLLVLSQIGAVPKRLHCLAGGLGFEPRFSESESDVLPLNYPPPGTPCYHFCSILQIDARRRGFPRAGLPAATGPQTSFRRTVRPPALLWLPSQLSLPPARSDR